MCYNKIGIILDFYHRGEIEMRRFNLVILAILTVFFGLLTVYAEDGATEFAGARFLVEEIIEENELPYGVKHTKIDGFTSTSLSGYDADGLGGRADLVVPGKYYDQIVNILEVPSSEGVRITSWANLNGHRWTLTTVRGLIADYESKHPGWKVIAAINGDFFDIGGAGNLPYQTNGTHASFGEYYKTTTGRQVGFTNDGRVDSLIGNEKVERTQYMKLAVYNDDGEIISEFDIDKINDAPGTGETAIYYALYDSDHNLIPASPYIESHLSYYVVEDAELALPNNANDFYGRGVITSRVPQELGAGQFAIVTDDEEIKEALDVGVRIRCQFELIGAYADAKDITGCGATIISNGAANMAAGMANRAPRTVIGRKADGEIVMMVIDGRNSGNGMYGADHTELAAIMHSYGCVEAYNLDGGGSSTMIIRREGVLEVMNTPSDGRERTDSNCLLVVARDPEIDVQAADLSEDALTFSVELINDSGHDIETLYVELNGELKEVKDGVVTFAGLARDTEYAYRLFYRDGGGNLNRIIFAGRQKTLKRMPELIKLEIVEDSEYFAITVTYDDPDKASTIDSCYLYINDKHASFTNGAMKVKKSAVGYRIDYLAIKYFYNLNDGQNIYVEKDWPEFEHYRDFWAKIQYIPYYINDYVDAVFK